MSMEKVGRIWAVTIAIGATERMSRIAMRQVRSKLTALSGPMRVRAAILVMHSYLYLLSRPVGFAVLMVLGRCNSADY
jgi:hypothetical protein